MIEEATGSAVASVRGGGSSGWAQQSVYITHGGAQFFVKTARGRSAAEMFDGEALGLRALGHTQTVRVPNVIGTGDLTTGSYIIMEHLTFGGRGDQAALGTQIGLMHKATPLVCVLLSFLLLQPCLQ